jgi:hypothetical protein
MHTWLESHTRVKGKTLANMDGDSTDYWEDLSSSASSDELAGRLERSENELDDDVEEDEDPVDVALRLWRGTAKALDGRRIFPASKVAVFDSDECWRPVQPWAPFMGPPDDFSAYRLCRQESNWKNMMDRADRLPIGVGEAPPLEHARLFQISTRSLLICSICFPDSHMLEARLASMQGLDLPSAKKVSSASSALEDTIEMLSARPGANAPPRSRGLHYVLDESGRPHLAHARGVGVYAWPLLDSFERNPWDLLNEDDEKEIVNYENQPLDEVLGVEVLPERRLLALRHARCVALADLEGDLKYNYTQPSFILACSFMPFSDQLALTDADGALTSVDLETKAKVTENSTGKVLHRWSSICAMPDDSPTLALAQRRHVRLFDLRVRDDGGKVIFSPWDMGKLDANCGHAEMIAAVAASPAKEHHLYCATSDRLVLLDVRMPERSHEAWTLGSKYIPSGCEVLRRSGGAELVVVYNESASVEWLDRAADGSSCMGTLDSPFDSLNTLYCDSVLALDYVTAPCNGLVFLPGVSGTTAVNVAVSNVAGMGFACQLLKGGHAPENIEDLVSRRWKDMDARIDETCLWADRPIAWKVTRLPSYAGNRPIPKVQDRPNKAFYRRERHRLKKKMAEKPSLSTELASSSQICKKGKAKSKKSSKTSSKNPSTVEGASGKAASGKAASVVKSDGDGPYNVFKALPWLPPFNPRNHNDDEGYKLAKILAKDPEAYPEVAGTADDTSRFRPINVVRRRSSVALPETTSEDPHYTMSAFLSGIEPAMTSTQESVQVTEAPPTALAASRRLGTFDDYWDMGDFSQADTTAGITASQVSTTTAAKVNTGGGIASGTGPTIQAKKKKKKKRMMNAGF